MEADEVLEPGQRKSINILREFAATAPDDSKPKRLVFDFFAKPVRIEGNGKVERIVVERTELDESGAARGTGETYEVPASLVISAIGYSTPQMEGVPYDERGGKFRNDGGLIAEFEGPGEDVKVANSAVAGAIGTSGRSEAEKDDIKTMLVKVDVKDVKAIDYSCSQPASQERQAQ